MCGLRCPMSKITQRLPGSISPLLGLVAWWLGCDGCALFRPDISSHQPRQGAGGLGRRCHGGLLVLSALRFGKPNGVARLNGRRACDSLHGRSGRKPASGCLCLGHRPVANGGATRPSAPPRRSDILVRQSCGLRFPGARRKPELTRRIREDVVNALSARYRPQYR